MSSFRYFSAMAASDNSSFFVRFCSFFKCISLHVIDLDLNIILYVFEIKNKKKTFKHGV